MLIAELKQRPNLVLRDNTNSRYILYTSNKKEVEEIEQLLALDEEISDERFNKYDLFFTNGIEINMVGNIKEIKSNHVSDLVEKIKEHTIKGLDRWERDEKIDEYICYQQHKTKSINNNVIKHEEKLSSFLCACELLQTKYFIVLKEIIEPKIIIFGTGGDIKQEELIKFNEMWKGEDSWK